MRSVDFIHFDADKNKTQLLQVKNRSNSGEQFSSSKVRSGTAIKKWHRSDAISGATEWD